MKKAAEKQRLAWEVLQDHASRPFAWNGEDDCCSLVDDILQVFHGRSFMDDFKFVNRRQAIELMAEHADLLGCVKSVLGEPDRPQASDIQDGEVLMGQQNGGEWILGVSLLGRMIVKTPNGVMDWPLEAVVYRWRVS